jgi:hypothetical protein
MKPNGEQAAFANAGSDQGPGSMGLTKREYFAAMAMQGILAAPKDKFTFHQDHIASMSVRYADELLKQLETK